MAESNFNKHNLGAIERPDCRVRVPVSSQGRECIRPVRPQPGVGFFTHWGVTLGARVRSRLYCNSNKPFRYWLFGALMSCCLWCGKNVSSGAPPATGVIGAELRINHQSAKSESINQSIKFINRTQNLHSDPPSGLRLTTETNSDCKKCWQSNLN